MDYASAGTDTSRTAILWAFIYMMHHPDVLQKVHREIDDVIGPHRPPSWKDRHNMPYTEAVMTEVMRIRPVLPLGVPHATVEDIDICGKRIPEGTTLVTNLYNACHDESFWQLPEKFDPGRFLGTSAKTNADHVIPFGTGKLYIN